MLSPATRIHQPDDVSQINEFYHDKGYTDGLPIVPPTPDLVSRFVAASGLEAGAAVATIAPLNGTATTELIAVNAVMAGCKPAYMPALIACVRAICAADFNIAAIQATTSPASPLFVVNGPARGALGVGSQYNCMGPGHRSNATIGRAIRLLLLNVGGGRVGEIDKATHGYPGKFTFCFAEAEELSPWQPLHVERGFAAAESVVTAIAGKAVTNLVEFSPHADDVITTLTQGITVSSSCSGWPMLVLSPMHARILGEAGWSKDRLRQHLFDHARVPLSAFSARARTNAPADRLVPLQQNGLVPLAEGPERFVIAVAGGPGGNQSVFIPTFGASTPASVRVEQPL